MQLRICWQYSSTACSIRTVPEVKNEGFYDHNRDPLMGNAYLYPVFVSKYPVACPEEIYWLHTLTFPVLTSNNNRGDRIHSPRSARRGARKVDSAPAPFLLLCGGGEERDCARSAEFETSSLVELSL